MKQITLRDAIKKFDEEGVAYSLRLYLPAGHVIEGPHHGYEAGYGISLDTSHGTSVTCVDVESIIAAEMVA